MEETKVRKTRTPRNPEYIFKGVKKLPLEVKVKLRDELNLDITAEVETIKAAAAHAEKIANGS